MPTFLDLPLENIIEALCLRCGPLDHPYDINTCPLCYNEPTPGLSYSATLASLCGTSRMLRAIATPHLYHQPICRRWWLLARTLILNPDLGLHVKHLRNDTWEDTYDVDEKEVAEVVEYRAQKAAEHAETLEDYERDAFLHMEEQNRNVFDANIPMDLMMSLSPNLEVLNASVDWGYIFACLLRPLPRLEQLNMSHASTEHGIYLEGIAPLAPLTPSLDSMLCHSVASCAEFPDPLSLKTLVFEHTSFNVSSLCNILSACPNLEQFEYGAGGSTVGYEQFRPAQADECLVRYAPKLRMLRLNFDLDSTGNGLLADEGYLMKSLAGLENLQHLSLDTRCLVPHLDPFKQRQMRGPDGNWVPVQQGPVPEPSASLFVNLLPRTIQTLQINKHYHGPSTDKLHTALTRLALTSKEQFPALKNVQVQGLKTEVIDELTKSFKQREIEFLE